MGRGNPRRLDIHHQLQLPGLTQAWAWGKGNAHRLGDRTMATGLGRRSCLSDRKLRALAPGSQRPSPNPTC